MPHYAVLIKVIRTPVFGSITAEVCCQQSQQSKWEVCGKEREKKDCA